MKTISMINIKGGVGKTISTVNVGAVLAEQGYRVLIVDLDAQANASQLLQCYGEEQDAGTIKDIFLEKKYSTLDAVVKTSHINMDMIPSHIKFAFSESKIITDTSRQPQTILRKALRQIAENYDYCLLDCPPNIGIVTLNALTASDYTLVPIKIDQFAIDGLGYLLETIYNVTEEFNPDLTFLGSFVTMDTTTTVNKAIKEQLRQMPAIKLFKTGIRNNVKVPESTFEKMPLVYSTPRAAASINYRKLTGEILELIDGKNDGI